MKKKEYHVIAVMSGTSLDGLDIIYVTFRFDVGWKFRIHHSETVSYTASWKETLKGLVDFTSEKLRETDEAYTLYLSEKIKEFVTKYNVNQIDFISSHGHTALHQPQNKVTYQIGNLPALAKMTGQLVVCDFRVQDVELGGQGAPLVPIGDRLLFSEYDYCINLGGFANISTEVNGKRIAYDVCPTNIVLNHYTRLLGHDFDAGGKIAEGGTISEDLLNDLNALEFYNRPYPKSLGLEWVKSEIIPIIDQYNLKTEDILRTFTEHIAIQISGNVKGDKKVSVLVTGGGAYNTYLISRIQSKTLNEIVIPKKKIIEFKEALIFGFLGILKIQGEVNCLSSVTGAKHDHSSGKIFYPEII